VVHCLTVFLHQGMKQPDGWSQSIEPPVHCDLSVPVELVSPFAVDGEIFVSCHRFLGMLWMMCNPSCPKVIGGGEGCIR